jgi:hypothetical protein
MGFIIGEYTIPSDTPIIYITDSNNARTLQWNIKNSHKFTHRKMIRGVKQGIDHSIANQLEYLTSKWPKDTDLVNMLGMCIKEERIFVIFGHNRLILLKI